ncbi:MULTISPECIES: hypothetical protein [Paenibacillus]|uniref:hypothetical protein n=1 Tax=Paenibacillus TaxID=44249 RepID=UPI0008FB8A12|nr:MULTISPECIES: hypothetical protein [Paenibacillus]APB75658.1 cysteine/glutathione ABC transporter ATP-binding protein/permease CydC [Paenibacillus polymyxa]PNQ79732.1 hypothetical protein C1T21_17160 [Paenibacillus sp. F4]POR25506.1 hypothetical protein CG775_21515 [Paenibacillus polymyxa]
MVILLNEENQMKIKGNDTFTYSVENGGIKEVQVQSIVNEVWRYGGKEISHEQLIKILNHIKVLASQG